MSNPACGKRRIGGEEAGKEIRHAASPCTPVIDTRKTG